MFNINWEYTCYECKCPMHVKLTVRNEDYTLFIRDFTTWAYLRPFCLHRNIAYYKFYGLRLRRVCIVCYFCPERVLLKNRETNVRTVIPRCVKSKQVQEILDYFTDFVEFRKRKDLEICIVEPHKRKFIPRLRILWKYE